MRRSVTHGRFSPVGRKLWRQSEGLSPRTGQLCLSPRRRSRGGVEVGDGGGSSPEGGPVLSVCDWAELRRHTPSLAATHQEESRWGFSGIASSAVRDEKGVGEIGVVPMGSGGGDPQGGRGHHAGRNQRGERETEGDGSGDDDRFDGGSEPYPVEEGYESSVGGIYTIRESEARAAVEDNDISVNSWRHGEEYEDGRSGLAVDCSGAAGMEHGSSDVDVECVTPASEGIDDDQSQPSIARCLSYTVKIPWGG